MSIKSSHKGLDTNSSGVSSRLWYSMYVGVTMSLTLMSTAYPDTTMVQLRRRTKGSTGCCGTLDVPLPPVVKLYTMYVGGLDKSVKLFGYQ